MAISTPAQNPRGSARSTRSTSIVRAGYVPIRLRRPVEAATPAPSSHRRAIRNVVLVDLGAGALELAHALLERRHVRGLEVRTEVGVVLPALGDAEASRHLEVA